MAGTSGGVREGPETIRASDEEQIEVIKETLVHISDGNEAEIWMGGEKDVRSDPIGGLPIPLGVGAADEFAKVGAPGSEAGVGAGQSAGVGVGRRGEVVFFDGAGRVAELELDDVVAVDLEEAGKAIAGVRKVGGEDGDVLERGEVPVGEDGKGDVVEGELEGAEGGEVDGHEALRGGVPGEDGGGEEGGQVGRGEVGGAEGELEVVQLARRAAERGAEAQEKRDAARLVAAVVVVVGPRQPLELRAGPGEARQQVVRRRVRLPADRAVVRVGGQARRVLDHRPQVVGIAALQRKRLDVQPPDPRAEARVEHERSSERPCLAGARYPDKLEEEVLRPDMPVAADAAHDGRAAEGRAVDGEAAEQIRGGGREIEEGDGGVELAVGAGEGRGRLGGGAEDGDPYLGREAGEGPALLPGASETKREAGKEHGLQALPATSPIRTPPLSSSHALSSTFCSHPSLPTDP